MKQKQEPTQGKETAATVPNETQATTEQSGVVSPPATAPVPVTERPTAPIPATAPPTAPVPATEQPTAPPSAPAPATAPITEQPTATAPATDKEGGGDLGGLTAEERETVLRYALKDPDIRKAIVGDYLKTVHAGAAADAPRVLSGNIGNSPALPPRAPRSLYEAGRIAEAMFTHS